VTGRAVAEIIGAVVLLGTAGRLELARRAAYQERLAALNQAAVADTTAHRAVGDLAVARRQVEQVQVQLTAKTHESNTRGVALAALQVSFDSLTADTTGTATTDTTAGLVGLRAEGVLDAADSAGIKVEAVVSVLGVGAGNPTAHWHWALQRSPLDLTIDFACRRDTAVVHVTGPPWARTDITKAIQQPEICNPPPRYGLFSFRLPSVPVAGGLLLLGWLLHR
jgi:hypothetical protein